MTARVTQYLMRDGHTRLSEQYFNPVWQDLDRRLDILERLQINWENAVTELQNNGLVRLNDVLIPLIEQAETELTHLIEVAQGLTDLITAPAIAHWRPSLSGTVTYGVNGLISTLAETLPDDVERLTTYAYNESDQVSTVTVDVGDVRSVTTYTYDEDGQVAEWSVEFSEL